MRKLIVNNFLRDRRPSYCGYHEGVNNVSPLTAIEVILGA